jgi:hypothetical protein
LWLQSERYPPPPEYAEYLICERFHKFPSEVEREPARDMDRLLIIMSVEAEVQRARNNG